MEAAANRVETQRRQCSTCLHTEETVQMLVHGQSFLDIAVDWKLGLFKGDLDMNHLLFLLVCVNIQGALCLCCITKKMFMCM